MHAVKSVNPIQIKRSRFAEPLHCDIHRSENQHIKGTANISANIMSTHISHPAQPNDFQIEKVQKEKAKILKLPAKMINHDLDI